MASELERIIRKRRRELEKAESQSRQDIFDAYDSAIDSIRGDLLLLTQQMNEAKANGEEIHPDWVRRQVRYQRLINQAAIQFQRFTDDGLMHLDAARLPTVSGGAQLASDLLDNAGIRSGTSMGPFVGNINQQALERFISSAGPGPLRDVFASHGEENIRAIQEELFNGIAGGKGANEILRNILHRIDGPKQKARLAATVRTEAMRSFNASLAEQFNKVSHLIETYRWVAAKSTRTCLACLSYDGRLFKTYQQKRHVNCRCICSPVPYGSTLEYQSGEDWLKQQDQATQLQMFPTADAWLAFNQGKVKLSDFAGVRQNKVWGPSVYQKSWKSVADKKGLPYQTDQGGEIGELAAIGELPHFERQKAYAAFLKKHGYPTITEYKPQDLTGFQKFKFGGNGGDGGGGGDDGGFFDWESPEHRGKLSHRQMSDLNSDSDIAVLPKAKLEIMKRADTHSKDTPYFTRISELLENTVWEGWSPKSDRGPRMEYYGKLDDIWFAVVIAKQNEPGLPNVTTTMHRMKPRKVMSRVRRGYLKEVERDGE